MKTCLKHLSRVLLKSRSPLHLTIHKIVLYNHNNSPILLQIINYLVKFIYKII